MRPTDARRERTIALLKEGYAAGCLGTATLERRVAAAARARSVAELRGLIADLPLRRLRDALRERLALVHEALTTPPGAPPTIVQVAPPPDGPGPWIIGRDPGCRLVIPAPTVSRRHAELRRAEAGWEVVDLGSTNGTWVNGWRVDRALVRPGDDLVIGDVRIAVVGS